MDKEELQELYETDDTASAFFDHIATRKRNQSETKVKRILKLLMDEGTEVSRGNMIRLLKNLQELGCGQFVTGRHGWPSRFIWDVAMTNAARIAAREEEDINDIEDGTTEEADFIEHLYNLRPDLELTIDLPVDLTEKEAVRLARFIKSLPMEEED